LLLAHANRLPQGCLAAGLIGIGGGGEADVTPYLAHPLFWCPGICHAVRDQLDVLCRSRRDWAGNPGKIVRRHGSYASLLVILSAALAAAAAILLLLPRDGIKEAEPQTHPP